MDTTSPPDDAAALSAPPGSSSAADSPDPRRSRQSWLRVVDFSRPTKFGPNEEQRMRRLHEAFCRVTATRMSGNLRVPLDLEFVDTSQRTWRDAYSMIPQNAACAVLDLQPYGTPCLLALEMPFLLLAVDKLLGSDDDEPHDRKLTSIDAALIRRVLADFAGTLTMTWQDLGNVEFEVTSVESEEDAALTVGAAEPTLAIAMEARLGSVSSSVVLLVPHASVARLLAETARRGTVGLSDGRAAADALERNVSNVNVTVRAEMGSTSLDLAQVLALVPGDRLRLEGPPPGYADLVVDDITVYRTQAGHHGSRRAVQLDAPQEETQA